MLRAAPPALPSPAASVKADTQFLSRAGNEPLQSFTVPGEGPARAGLVSKNP